MMERDSRSSIIIIIIIIVNIFIKAYQPSQGRSMAATTRGREANIFFNFIGVYSGYDEEDDQKTSGESHAVFDQKIQRSKAAAVSSHTWRRIWDRREKAAMARGREEEAQEADAVMTATTIKIRPAPPPILIR